MDEDNVEIEQEENEEPYYEFNVHYSDYSDRARGRYMDVNDPTKPYIPDIY